MTKEIKVPLGSMVKVFKTEDEAREYLKIGEYVGFYQAVRELKKRMAKTDYFREKTYIKVTNSLEEIFHDYNELYE